jgi:hypothetical protein
MGYSKTHGNPRKKHFFRGTCLQETTTFNQGLRLGTECTVTLMLCFVMHVLKDPPYSSNTSRTFSPSQKKFYMFGYKSQFHFKGPVYAWENYTSMQRAFQ